jgi:hypothetical protein
LLRSAVALAVIVGGTQTLALVLQLRGYALTWGLQAAAALTLMTWIAAVPPTHAHALTGAPLVTAPSRSRQPSGSTCGRQAVTLTVDPAMMSSGMSHDSRRSPGATAIQRLRAAS